MSSDKNVIELRNTQLIHLMFSVGIVDFGGVFAHEYEIVFALNLHPQRSTRPESTGHSVKVIIEVIIKVPKSLVFQASLLKVIIKVI